ncbi:MAG TPA: hypothetical protein VN457_02595, partial [Chlamydiales bacterium]|nr:hypothetical protein [Chlamydiales bacterium]
MPIDSIDSSMPLVGPTPTTTPVTGPASTTSESEWMSTLSPSDKKMIEELAAMLPKTWIDPVLAQQLWLSMMMNLGLGTVADPSRPPRGALENAIVLVMLGNWLNNLTEENENIREKLKTE